MVRRRQQVRAKHGPMTGSAPYRANGDGTRRVSNPEIFLFCKMAHPTRFERVTFAFGGQRSIQLSYGCVGVHLAHWPGIGNGQVGPSSVKVTRSNPAGCGRKPYAERAGIVATPYCPDKSRPKLLPKKVYGQHARQDACALRPLLISSRRYRDAG